MVAVEAPRLVGFPRAHGRAGVDLQAGAEGVQAGFQLHLLAGDVGDADARRQRLREGPQERVLRFALVQAGGGDVEVLLHRRVRRQGTLGVQAERRRLRLGRRVSVVRARGGRGDVAQRGRGGGIGAAQAGRGGDIGAAQGGGERGRTQRRQREHGREAYGEQGSVRSPGQSHRAVRT